MLFTDNQTKPKKTKPNNSKMSENFDVKDALSSGRPVAEKLMTSLRKLNKSDSFK